MDKHPYVYSTILKYLYWFMKLTWGENSESNVSFNPLRILSWTSIVVESWLFVFHFSVKVVPYSANLYFVSKLPSTLPESVFDEPPYQKRIIQTWFDSYKDLTFFNIIYVAYSYLRWNLLHLRFLSSILICDNISSCISVVSQLNFTSQSWF